jgi:hypothetical protein
MRVCTICSHPERAAIDRALVDGTSLRDIAGQFGTTKSALDRHKNHLAPALTLAKQAERVTESTSLLSRVERIMVRLETICEAATAEKDWLPAIAASRELRGCLELLGKLSGEIQSGTRVGIQIVDGRPARTVVVGSEEWEESFAVFLDNVIAERPQLPVTTKFEED